MKVLLSVLFTILPFTLSAQFSVMAYKTTDQYNRKVIRIEIKNTGNQDLRIRNATSGPENGTILHFSTTKKQERNVFFSFHPDPTEHRKFRVIEKGKSEKVDAPLNEVSNNIPIDKDIYLLGHIEYYFPEDNERHIKEIAIKVE
ncbi:hypothetical protein SAMN05216357_10438 [Porphyromonadaceae bacterium KH3CP3RA]|nr:hypothetical protein SAMN05216357_10438 [Porphyromonadaceae bacterium KH3CP3RA]